MFDALGFDLGAPAARTSTGFRRRSQMAAPARSPCWWASSSPTSRLRTWATCTSGRAHICRMRPIFVNMDPTAWLLRSQRRQSSFRHRGKCLDEPGTCCWPTTSSSTTSAATFRTSYVALPTSGYPRRDTPSGGARASRTRCASSSLCERLWIVPAHHDRRILNGQADRPSHSRFSVSQNGQSLAKGTICKREAGPLPAAYLQLLAMVSTRSSEVRQTRSGGGSGRFCGKRTRL